MNMANCVVLYQGPESSTATGVGGGGSNLFFVYERILNLVAEILITRPQFMCSRKKLVRSESAGLEYRMGLPACTNKFRQSFLLKFLQANIG